MKRNNFTTEPSGEVYVTSWKSGLIFYVPEMPEMFIFVLGSKKAVLSHRKVFTDFTFYVLHMNILRNQYLFDGSRYLQEKMNRV